MDQPTAEQALNEMGVLVGEWSQRRHRPAASRGLGRQRAISNGSRGGQLLLERSTVDVPEAPNGFCVYGCDAANGIYYQLYTDDRNVCRVYQMSIGNGEWRLAGDVLAHRRQVSKPDRRYAPTAPIPTTVGRSDPPLIPTSAPRRLPRTRPALGSVKGHGRTVSGRASRRRRSSPGNVPRHR